MPLPLLHRQRRDLRRAAGVFLLNAQLSRCFADAAFVASPAFRNRLKLSHFLRQPYPLGNVLVAFERGQFLACHACLAALHNYLGGVAYRKRLLLGPLPAASCSRAFFSFTPWSATPAARRACLIRFRFHFVRCTSVDHSPNLADGREAWSLLRHQVCCASAPGLRPRVSGGAFSALAAALNGDTWTSRTSPQHRRHGMAKLSARNRGDQVATLLSPVLDGPVLRLRVQRIGVLAALGEAANCRA
jgi:hypothetical protein